MLSKALSKPRLH